MELILRFMILGQMKMKLCTNMDLKSSKSYLNENLMRVVLTVSHNKFKELRFLSLKNKKAIIYDVKNFINKSLVDGKL